jgi:hypothetical protein
VWTSDIELDSPRNTVLSAACNVPFAPFSVLLGDVVIGGVISNIGVAPCP